MKLLERLIEHHRRSMHRILDACRVLGDERLDAELSLDSPLPWDCCKESLRRLLRGSVGLAGPWTAAINDHELVYDGDSIDGLHQGLDKKCDEIVSISHSIEVEGRWDLTFVDALCEPPEVFSVIGVFGHMVTYSAYRRTVLLNELKEIGIGDLGFGDPIEFAPARRAAS